MGFCTVSSARAKSPGFQTYDTQKLLTFDGVWISRGYGILWQIRHGRSAEYEINGQYCIFRRKQRGLPEAAEPHMLLDREKRVMRIGVDDGIGYLHTFDRRSVLPAQCLKKPDTSPAGVFNAVDQIFANRYAFFKLRKLDWSARVRAFRPRLASVRTDAELFELIGKLLEPIGDEHVSLRGEVAGEEKDFSVSRKPIALHPRLESTSRLPGSWSPAAGVRLLGPRAKRNASGSIVYGMLDRETGYLNIGSLWWRRVRDLDETLDSAIDLFQGAKRVIVDVSRNGGGGENLAKRVAERFARERTTGLYKYAGDAKGDKPQAITIVPSRSQRFLGPTYVISSGETFSAAETLVMYMSALDNVTHVGRPTGGALSDVLMRTLPNGWRLGLSNEVYLDVNRRAWEGIGIPPKIDLDVHPNKKTVTAGDLAAARKTLAAIRSLSGKSAGRD